MKKKRKPEKINWVYGKEIFNTLIAGDIVRTEKKIKKYAEQKNFGNYIPI